MASKTLFRAILQTISSAPESVSGEYIHQQVGGAEEDFDTAINQLLEAGYIKEHATKDDFYFTRTPRRDEIRMFLNNPDYTIAGVTFTPDVASMPVASTPTPRITAALRPGFRAMNTLNTLSSGINEETQYRAALNDISGSEHSCPVSMIHYASNAQIMCDNLVAAGLIKEDTQNPGRYFTRKPNRELIDDFQRGLISLDELFDNAKKPRAATPVAHPVAPVAAEPQAPTTGSEPTQDAPQYYMGITDRGYQVFLGEIINSEGALDLNDTIWNDTIIRVCVDAGLIKEDVNKPKHYFTRLPNRLLIHKFINGHQTLDELFENANAPTKPTREVEDGMFPYEDSTFDENFDCGFDGDADGLDEGAVESEESNRDLVDALRTIQTITRLALKAAGR